MPHERPRHIVPLLRKSLKFWPVVCLVGSRQVGKSTLLRNQTELHYLSLDDAGLASLASQNPKELLTPPCIIDEAQKAPGIFDAVKLDVDREKRPGKYVLTGSVQFSKRTLIRESLTGRAKTIRMYPLTCSESLSLEFQDRWVKSQLQPARVTRKDLQRLLSRGGMPAIFSARTTSETKSYWTSLIDSYVHRDLLMAVPKNARPSLGMAILKAIAETLALGEFPTFARILKKTGETRATVQRHLQGLEDMMILHRIPHWKASATKEIFIPFDTAFFLTLLRIENPAHDAAVHSACLQITLVNEALAQAQAADRYETLTYAVSPKGEAVHLITTGTDSKPVFWKILEEPVPHAYQLRFLSALLEKEGGTAKILSSTERPFKQGGLEVAPWEMVL